MRLPSSAALLLLAGILHAQRAPSDNVEQTNPAAAAPEAPPFISCPAGAPLGGMDLQVQSGTRRLPFRTINRLSEGDTLFYTPILRGRENRPGEVALVLVPEKRKPEEPDILVTDPKAADKSQQWKIDRTISVAARR
jgi:hypothetical protein